MGGYALAGFVSKIKSEHHRRANMEAFDPTGWIKHQEYHYSTVLNGSRLDYWPSTQKFSYKGVIYQGDVYEFMDDKLEESAT